MAKSSSADRRRASFVPVPRSSAAVPPHVEHVREHLGRLADGALSVVRPEDVFLGPEDERHFYEVIGLRLVGTPEVLLAAFRFRRLPLPGEEYARESLTAYFSAPPSPRSPGVETGAPGEVTALFPRVHEAIPTFLSKLRAGAAYAPVHFSPAVIQVAFDLRLKNPFRLESERERAGPLVPHLFRTTAGHILKGMSHGRDRKPGDHDFVAVTECEQHTPVGPFRLPPVMVNRSFLALAVPLADEPTRLAATHWAPFQPGTGTRRHLLLG